jgi:hypothetical protein
LKAQHLERRSKSSLLKQSVTLETSLKTGLSIEWIFRELTDCKIKFFRCKTNQQIISPQSSAKLQNNQPYVHWNFIGTAFSITYV